MRIQGERLCQKVASAWSLHTPGGHRPPQAGHQPPPISTLISVPISHPAMASIQPSPSPSPHTIAPHVTLMGEPPSKNGFQCHPFDGHLGTQSKKS